MRCQSCNKFVPNGDPEVNIENGEDFETELVDGKLIITCQPKVRVMIPCGECGQDLKDTTLNLDMETEHVCDKLPKEEPEGGINIEGSLEAEPIDDFKTTDRHGKPIKNPRYQAHLYGASVTATVTCPYCQEEIEFTESDEVESSSMDECQ